MSVHRVLIDATDCPQAVIDRHLRDSGIEYSLYHRDAFHLFIADDCSVECAVSATDLFFHNYADRLNRLSTDESQTDDLSPELKLEFTFLRSIPSRGLTLPERLLANIAKTHVPVCYDYTRF